VNVLLLQHRIVDPGFKDFHVVSLGGDKFFFFIARMVRKWWLFLMMP